MKSFQVFSVLAVIFTLAACSGGGRNQVPGRQCGVNWTPIDLKFKANQKMWKMGDNDSAIPAGTYVYQGSHLVFTEKGDKPGTIDIEDVGDRAGNFKTRINCVRNGLNITEKNLSVATNIVSKMVAIPGTSVDVEAKEISFSVKDRRLVSESKAISKPAYLKDVYEGKAEDVFVIQTYTPVDYEVRSVYSNNEGTYIVSVKLKKVN